MITTTAAPIFFDKNRGWQYIGGEFLQINVMIFENLDLKFNRDK
jgi:hypothetical protein